MCPTAISIDFVTNTAAPARHCKAPEFMDLGAAPPVTINRRNFQTEIETEANKWSEFDGPVPSFSSGTVYGE